MFKNVYGRQTDTGVTGILLAHPFPVYFQVSVFGPIGLFESKKVTKIRNRYN